MPAEVDPGSNQAASAAQTPAPGRDHTSGPATPSAGVMIMALAPFAFAYLFSYLYRGANAVVAGDLVAELGLSPAELGFLTAAYLAAFAAFQLPLGVLLDRYGPRRVQAALVALGACGALLFSLGRDALTLTIARGIIGVAFSGGLMASFKAVVIWVNEPRRALANACLMSMGGIGLLISTTPLELASRSYGWRATFMVLAAATLVASAVIFFVVPERKGSAAAGEPFAKQIRQVGTIYRDRVFLALAPFLAMTAGTHIALQTLWAGPWLRDVVGLDRLGVANSLFVMAVGFVASILLAGVITDALVRRGYSLLTAMLLFQVTFMVVQAGLLFNPTDPLIALVLWSLFSMSGHAAVVAYPWLSRYFGAALSGRSNSAANLLMFLWAFLGQYAAGAIIGWFPAPAPGRYAPVAYQTAMAIFLALQVASLLWLFANRRRLREAETRTA